MTKLSEPKYSLWICRILPIACISLFGILALFIMLIDKTLIGGVPPTLMVIIYVIYFAFILWYLPGILFKGNYRWLRLIPGIAWSDPWWYIPFAILTIGIGPLIWYWLKVDPVLVAMCNKESIGKITK